MKAPAACLLTLLAFAPPAVAAPVLQQIDDAALGALTVSCDDAPRADYRAKTASGAPLTGAYARERGADKGLVRLVDEGSRRVRRYVVPRSRIHALISVRIDAAAPDWADLIFTRRGLILVRTSTADAGVFTVAEVYRLGASDAPDRRLIKDGDLAHMLDLGLAAYRPQTGRCVR